MLRERSSSVKMKVFAAEVARVMRSIAARGEEADLERARKGWKGDQRRFRYRVFVVLLLPMHSGPFVAPFLNLI